MLVLAAQAGTKTGQKLKASLDIKVAGKESALRNTVKSPYSSNSQPFLLTDPAVRQLSSETHIGNCQTPVIFIPFPFKCLALQRNQ